MSSQIAPSIAIFGGTNEWSPSKWTASDDRVRGGASQSYLSIEPSSNTARFHGHLDITTLGGAGFASQRTISESQTWDLAKCDGIKLELGKGDGKMYTLIIKDEILPQLPDGKEASSVSWEYDFRAVKSSKKQFTHVARWAEFKPTYRGREKPDSRPLKKDGVKRFSIMMRSFFGTQEGDFEVEVKSIEGVQIEGAGTETSEKEDRVTAMLALCTMM